MKGAGVHRIIICLTLCAFCILGGCGYHLSGTTETPSLIAGKSIAIPMWRSKIFRPYLESILTGSLVDEFALRSGGLVTGEEDAEMVLTGTILSYATIAVSYTAQDQVREYRATMTIDAALTEKRSQRVLWKGVMSSSQDYPANPVGIDLKQQNRIALQQNNEEAAVREISRKLAEQLYQKVTENF
jgi:outer membrane lipopolysaccharide assembly protein LptE/RlpB